MKWAVLALALSVAGASYLLFEGRKIRADQGYVRSDDGQEWRLKRMQGLGLGEERVAVYEKTR